jgi:hypothetical protein
MTFFLKYGLPIIGILRMYISDIKEAKVMIFNILIDFPPDGQGAEAVWVVHLL